MNVIALIDGFKSPPSCIGNELWPSLGRNHKVSCRPPQVLAIRHAPDGLVALRCPSTTGDLGARISAGKLSVFSLELIRLQQPDTGRAHPRRDAQQWFWALRGGGRLTANRLTINSANLGRVTRVKQDVNLAALPVADAAHLPVGLRAVDRLAQRLGTLRIIRGQLRVRLLVKLSVLDSPARQLLDLGVSVHASHGPLHHGLTIAVVNHVVSALIERQEPVLDTSAQGITEAATGPQQARGEP